MRTRTMLSEESFLFTENMSTNAVKNYLRNVVNMVSVYVSVCAMKNGASSYIHVNAFVHV